LVFLSKKINAPHTARLSGVGEPSPNLPEATQAHHNSTNSLLKRRSVIAEKFRPSSVFGPASLFLGSALHENHARGRTDTDPC
jgi:hypothetical protein